MNAKLNKPAIQPNKIYYLLLSLLFDGIGMLSFTIPYLGEFTDVIWAPLSCYIMVKMYRGKVGKIAGIIGTIEELIPFTDVIPTFTLTWLYHFYIQKKGTSTIK
ncbi:hypothetical protein [Flavobacterium algicola]|uniref:hypothetical protein n=1 Tax=Flavobacterium algicola TaxID=556529 RepID=UPI001EFD6B74|nr:hypothetical protein [Flavobacterium algicola]MCG9790993.1 hypothetical protein [Flavobacterium algicola]